MSQQPSLTIKAMIVVLTLSLSNWVFAQPGLASGTVKEDPSALAMTGDLLVVRPVMFGITVLGSAIWVLALPFTAAGGNIKDSANTLVVGPARTTFVRCLGCRNVGYQRVVGE